MRWIESGFDSVGFWVIKVMHISGGFYDTRDLGVHVLQNREEEMQKIKAEI